MVCALLFIAASVAAVCFYLWRISLPWDERGRPWFPFLRARGETTTEREPAPPPAKTSLSGWARLHPLVPLEGRFEGWSAEPRRTHARMVLGDDGEVKHQRLSAPVDEGALAFTAPDGTLFLAEPLPQVSVSNFDEETRTPSAHELLHFFVGRGGLLAVVGPEGALIVAADLRSKDVKRLLATLRPVGEAEAPARLEDRIELRVCNDALLAQILESHPDRKLAFEVLAPGLNVLFIDKPHPNSTLMTPLDHEALAAVGGTASFLTRMASLVDPLTEPLQDMGNDMFTNERGTQHAASLVTQPRFFERLAPKLGEAILVGVPSVSRLLLARDTPKHRQALAAMLDASPQVETTTLLSTRVYRVTGAEWDEWSVVDEKN